LTKLQPEYFDVSSYTPGVELSRLLDELGKAENKLVMQVGEIGIILNEIVKQGRRDGLLDMQIRELIDSFLGENRTIRKYLPKELKKHNYPEQRKRMEEIDTDSNVEANKLIEDSSPIQSLEEIRNRSGTIETPAPGGERQDIEVLHNKIDEQERLIDDFKKTVKDQNEQIAESESRLMSLDQEIKTLGKQLKDQTDNLRETPAFKKATRQIEFAYEDQINRWRAEYERGKEKFLEINRLPKTVEFSPGSLKCLDLIFENQNGMLYLQHDGYEVIKVSAVKPIEQGGEIVG
jgi:chromosome segregation ATPase